MSASYSAVYLVREISYKIFNAFQDAENISSHINKETIDNYNKIETLANEYLEKNILKINQMIKSGVIDSSIEEFKKIIQAEKYPKFEGELPINLFAVNLIKSIKYVYTALKFSYDEETISKLILDNLNDFNEKFGEALQKKEELDDEEKKLFKKDVVFIKKNIDNGIDEVDFKNFKKKFTSIYKKLLPKD